MPDLLWPGDERAGDLVSGPTVLRAMLRVEQVWLAALVDAGIAPAPAADDLSGLLGAGGAEADLTADVDAIALAAESGGNPVIPLLKLLRARLTDRNPVAARWLHRGLTSQDVLDTALQLVMRDVVRRLGDELAAQDAALARLAGEHRDTVMAARTLTQHAVPTTFGAKAAGWLQGIRDGARALAGTDAPAQLGGAAGTLSALAELAAARGHADPARAALDVAADAATRLGLAAAPPWHTARAPVTRLGDALVTCSDAFGHIANDVLTLSRPEIGELSEPVAAGRGGSSAMPQKVNPVLAVLVRRAALTAPATASLLHLAAADARDERPDGSWHVEWATLATLARRTVVAASQTTELVTGVRVHADRMAATARAAADDLLAEQRSTRDVAGAPAHPDPTPAGYVGTAPLLAAAAAAPADGADSPAPSARADDDGDPPTTPEDPA